MKIKRFNRSFEVNKKIILKHTANIKLNSNEMITLKNNKMEFDITKKKWGFYATPSINKRLKSFGFLSAIIQNNNTKNIFVVLIDKKKKKLFTKYIKTQDIRVLKWLQK